VEKRGYRERKKKKLKQGKKILGKYLAKLIGKVLHRVSKTLREMLKFSFKHQEGSGSQRGFLKRVAQNFAKALPERAGMPVLEIPRGDLKNSRSRDRRTGGYRGGGLKKDVKKIG